MSDFSDTIDLLWSALGLPAPALSGEARHTSLSIDDSTVNFHEAPNGRNLIVSSTVGPLSEESSARERQIGEILQTNLAHLYTCRAGALLDNSEPRRPVVVVEAVHAYASRDVEALGRLIEDVLRLRAAQLSHINPQSSMSARAPLSGMESGSMVFRP